MFVLIGCSGVAQKDYDRVFGENTELRERNASLEKEAEASRRNAAQLASQVDDLTAQIDRLAADTRVASADPTGFEGIPDVGVSRQAGGEVVVAIAGDVLFDSGSIALKPSAKTSLDSVATVLKGRYGANLIRIEGHTDTDPIRKSKWKTNERLSFERANAVEQYLASKGVKSRRMYSAAFGSANPKANKKASRRVEIVILARSG